MPSSSYQLSKLVNCMGLEPHTTTSDSSVTKQANYTTSTVTKRYHHHTGIQPAPTDMNRKGVEEGATHTAVMSKEGTWGQQVNLLHSLGVITVCPERAHTRNRNCLLVQSTPHNKPLTLHLRQRLTQGMLASLNTRSDLVLLLIHTRLQHVGVSPHHTEPPPTHKHNDSHS